MSIIVVTVAAFLAAGLTMYSGFGLGTLMLPVFALFLPVEMAVVATALVHGANNVFKVSLLGRHADLEVVLKFGLTAIVAAVFGAMALAYLVRLDVSLNLNVNDIPVSRVTPEKAAVGLLMIFFALFDLLPVFRKMEFKRRWLPLGGLLSGFFGGLSGHQGALRSAFLAKSGLGTDQFVGSNAVIGFLVDLTRITVYLGLFVAAGVHGDVTYENIWPLVIAGSLAAFCGVLLGKRYLHKVTMRSVRTLVGILLFAVGLALLLGVL